MYSEVLDDDFGTHEAQNVAGARGLHYVVLIRESDGAELPNSRGRRIMRLPAQER